ncbi:MAG: Crp/Fnr family transcriptional regulator [Pseudomonadota bacterium]
MLDDLPDDRKIEFLDSCSVRMFANDTEILSQSLPVSGMFLIAHGSVEVSFMSTDGHKSIIYHAKPGEVLGAIEAIAERDCAATCLAFANTTVLYCARALLFDQLRSPVFIRNFAVNAHEILTRDNTFKAVDQFFTVEQKICMYLMYLSSRKSKFTQSQSYLANAVGCSRQTVNKELGRLRDLNIVDQKRGAISVLDPERLQKRIDELGVLVSETGRK